MTNETNISEADLATLPIFWQSKPFNEVQKGDKVMAVGFTKSDREGLSWSVQRKCIAKNVNGEIKLKVIDMRVVKDTYYKYEEVCVPGEEPLRRYTKVLSFYNPMDDVALIEDGGCLPSGGGHQ